jgi:hypothetical protein
MYIKREKQPRVGMKKMNRLSQFKMEVSILEDYINSPTMFVDEIITLAKSFVRLDGYDEAVEDYPIVDTIAKNLKEYVKIEDVQILSVLRQNIGQFLKDTRNDIE